MAAGRHSDRGVAVLANWLGQVFIEAAAEGRRAGPVKIGQIFPWFILGFLGMAVLNILGLFSSAVGSALAKASKFLILMAMAGVDLGINPRKIRKTGSRPMFLGLAASLVRLLG